LSLPLFLSRPTSETAEPWTNMVLPLSYAAADDTARCIHCTSRISVFRFSARQQVILTELVHVVPLSPSYKCCDSNLTLWSKVVTISTTRFNIQ
jgi:hypothetical protein